VVNARLPLEREVAAKAVAGDPFALCAVAALTGATRRQGSSFRCCSTDYCGLNGKGAVSNSKFVIEAN
jgi:hypothetical protein